MDHCSVAQHGQVEASATTLGRNRRSALLREGDAIVQQGKSQPHQLSPSPRGATLTARTRAADLLQHREFEALIDEGLVGQILVTPTLWEGAVTLPHSPGLGARYRLAIAEYEEYLVDDAMPYDRFPTRKDRRIVFIEYVELG